MEVIREELEAVKAEFGDARRTEIVASQVDLTIADLITEEDRVVTISHGGYAKSQPLAAYQAQRRGGKGKSATGMKDEDYIEHLLVANSHATLLLFSSKGGLLAAYLRDSGGLAYRAWPAAGEPAAAGRGRADHRDVADRPGGAAAERRRR
ncbi:DNA gyrase C-terminal beta-propeller domain-containing protein [Pseudomonas aeruginosa]|nr:DNA gyrase C-terminal beta-propeller domain-containing protein [Pseudomonas aeruginosa]